MPALGTKNMEKVSVKGTIYIYYFLVTSVCDTTVLSWIRPFRISQGPPRSCCDPLRIVTNGTVG